ncbi:formate dehydrogenase accessory sulfurtransferase FdhD [Sinomonas sp. JGH33]|uniref:Sulfur carrier protein FdhD n=1 Tax=Sinomonas terricola TaxID=3110330 RepID=A0ABU5T3D4_9MICC|nr:formate dehydrogenase accessory sulfurtransferase FdhD [Sinomonas sp. JGH33]MEA5454165.1 formate dehydrogenase accessory sulfurtransferase FdhD [Sinomonas sp. JGH33]
MGRLSQRRKVHKYVLDSEHRVRNKEDVLAVEEPLEIRLATPGGALTYSVTMRTPGDDFDLVAGFLVSEGVVWEPGQLVSERFCGGEDADGLQTFNVVQAQLRPDVALPETGRNVYTSSSCGICGTDSIESVRRAGHHSPADDGVRLLPELVAGLPARLREAQALFEKTGGVHAAGLFRVGDGGTSAELLCLREDVGRHNAVDKVVGWALRSGLLPLEGTVLQVSGRASFELVQKAAMAGIPVLAAVSAPSSLAVELAEESGVTLVGFSRGTGFNVYAGHERLLS